MNNLYVLHSAPTVKEISGHRVQMLLYSTLLYSTNIYIYMLSAVHTETVSSTLLPDVTLPVT